MARSKEERLPVAWVESFARAHGARSEVKWDTNDVSVRLVGAFDLDGETAPWELKLDGSLDTDYPAYTSLFCQLPDRVRAPGFVARDNYSSPTATGTEADLVFAVVSAARAWWRGRQRATEIAEQEEAAQRAGVEPPLVVGYELEDPEGVLTDEIKQLLDAWPTMTHARSHVERESFQLGYRPELHSLGLTSRQYWGEALCAHKLRIVEGVARRLAAWE